MTRIHVRHIFALIAVVACITGLQACGGTSSGGSSSTAPLPPGITLPVLTPRSVPVMVTLPAGLSGAMTAETSIGKSSIPAGGATTVPIFNGGPQLARVYDSARHLLLMGWVGDGRSALSTHTTAEVLLYFNLRAFLLPGEGRMKVVDSLATRTEVQTLADAIAAALSTDPKALGGTNAAINSAALAARDQILASGRAATLPAASVGHTRGILVNPTDPKSGITVNQEGLNSVVLRNDYRRRAVTFVERESYKLESGGEEVPSPAEITEIDISPTTGVTSIAETLVDVVNGKIGYAGVDAGPIPLPVYPSNAASTKYKVIVVGPGVSKGDFDKLTEEQKTKTKALVIKSFVVDFAVPLIVNTIMPLKEHAVEDYLNLTNSSVLVEDFVKTLGQTAPELNEKAATGDMSGALHTLYNTIATSKSARLLFFEMIFRILEPHLKFEPLTEFRDKGEDFLNGLNLSEKILTGIDSLVQIVQISQCSLADTWEITANKSKVRLNPQKADIGKNEIQTFTAVVPTATGPGAPALTYRWSTTGAHGKIRDTNHSPATSFDSSSASVVYEADRTTSGKDQVTVEVFEINGQQRNSIGTTSSDIVVRDVLPTIVPDRASLKKGETQQFKAKLDASANDGGVLTYRWFSTGKFGNVTGPETNGETSSNQAGYRSTADGEGEDTMAVEVFSTKDGQKRSLGIARAQVKTEIKKSIVFGDYITAEVHTNDRLHVGAIVLVPRVEGAKTYTIRCYNFYDPDYYGRVIHLGPFPEPVPGNYAELVNGQYRFGISGSSGPDGDATASIAFYDGRFKGMTVEVTVTY